MWRVRGGPWVRRYAKTRAEHRESISGRRQGRSMDGGACAVPADSLPTTKVKGSERSAAGAASAARAVARKVRRDGAMVGDGDARLNSAASGGAASRLVAMGMAMVGQRRWAGVGTALLGGLRPQHRGAFTGLEVLQSTSWG